MQKSYKIVNDEVIQLLEGPYTGITYQYGKVLLEPDEEKDELRLKFEYTIHDGQPSDVNDFQQYIGAILHEILEEQLARNQIVYTGGVDAD